jgi:ankyrin repeat protein
MLPPTLDGVVRNRLNVIDEQPPRLRHIAANTLMWLSHSKRPLLVQELCEVLALQSSEAYLDQGDFPAPLIVVESCMGLVTIDSSSTASLSHSSIGLHLRNMQNKLFSFGVFRTCWKCLQYIELRNFADCDPTPEEETDILTQHPFLDYASANWMYHVQDVTSEAFSLLQNLRDQPPESVDPEANASILEEILNHIWTATDRLILRGSTSSLISSWPLLFHFNTTPESVHKDVAKHEMTMPRRLTSGLSPLHICARFSFVDRARSFLESRSPYDAPRDNKTSDDVLMEGEAFPVKVLSGLWTPLHEAARCNSLLIARMLIENGYRADTLDEDHRTPLHYASYNGHSQMISILLPSASLDIMEHKSGKTALHFAAKLGHLEVIRILLAAGAIPDVRDIHDRTALHYAAENGHKFVAQTLLERGANPKAVNQDGQTALHCAVLGRSEDLVRSLLMQDPSVILVSDYFGRTPLHLAAETAFLIVVEMLLAEGAYVDAVDNSSKTPLMYAVLSGRSEVVKALLQRFADPNFDSSINTDSLKVESPRVSLHEQRGMDSSDDAPEFSGETALLVAVRRKNIELVELLLRAGAIVDWMNSRGETALFIAAADGMVDIAKLLVEAGANVNVRTRSNSTPLEAALKHRKVEMF